MRWRFSGKPNPTEVSLFSKGCTLPIRGIGDSFARYSIKARMEDNGLTLPVVTVVELMESMFANHEPLEPPGPTGVVSRVLGALGWDFWGLG